MAKIAIDPEIIWAAGLFDGEGSIFASTATKANAPRLTIALVMTERDTVERFAQAVGIGYVTQVHEATEDRKAVYRWTLQGTNDVKAAFAKLEPYLSAQKHNQGRRALMQREAYEASGQLYARTLCRNGHPFPENRREWPNGKGYCILCLRNRQNSEDRVCARA